MQPETPSKPAISPETDLQHVLDNENSFGERWVNPGDLYSLRDTAKILGVSQTVVWMWVNAKMLPSVRIGNTRAINIVDARRVNDDMLKRRMSVIGRRTQRRYGSVAS